MLTLKIVNTDFKVNYMQAMVQLMPLVHYMKAYQLILMSDYISFRRSCLLCFHNLYFLAEGKNSLHWE